MRTREDLERDIESSQQVRRYAIGGAAIVFVLGVVIGVWWIALFGALVGICGAWITSMHIGDFEKDLRGIPGAKRGHRTVPRTAAEAEALAEQRRERDVVG